MPAGNIVLSEKKNKNIITKVVSAEQIKAFNDSFFIKLFGNNILLYSDASQHSEITGNIETI